MRHFFRPAHFVFLIAIVVVLVGAVIVISSQNSEADQDASARATPYSTAQTAHSVDSPVRLADVPELPFPDNPDPTLCGIPAVWGTSHNRAWLKGVYEGVMVQPTVFLYDSHLRYQIKAQAPHGTEVQIILVQSNPVLDFYLVKIPSLPAGQNEGWVPAPFLSFEPTRVFG